MSITVDPFDRLELPDRKPRLVSVPGGVPTPDLILEVEAEHAAKTHDPHLKLRLQPTIYDHNKQYAIWLGVTWIVEFRDLRQMVRFREDLDRFVQKWISQQRELEDVTSV